MARSISPRVSGRSWARSSTRSILTRARCSGATAPAEADGRSSSIGARRLRASCRRATSRFQAIHCWFPADGPCRRRSTPRQARSDTSTSPAGKPAKNAGGYDVAAAGGVFFNSGKMHNVSDGSLICLAGADVLTPDAMYAADGTNLVAFSPKVTKVPYTDRRGKKAFRNEPTPLWRHELPVKLSKLFLRAGGRLFGASNSGDVVGIDLSDPSKFAWQAKVIGEPKTMLAAHGRLFVVTSDGRVWCFAAGEVARPTQYSLPNDPPSAASADGRPGKPLISLAGVNAGYAVVLGADKALVDSLVAQSKLDVIVLDADAAKVADLREHIGKSYGLRVSAIAADLSAAKLPPYLASLIIAPAGASPESLPEAYRILRPYGGTMCLPGGEASTTQIKSLIAAGELPGAEVAVKDGWVLRQTSRPAAGRGGVDAPVCRRGQHGGLAGQARPRAAGHSLVRRAEQRGHPAASRPRAQPAGRRRQAVHRGTRHAPGRGRLHGQAAVADDDQGPRPILRHHRPPARRQRDRQQLRLDGRRHLRHHAGQVRRAGPRHRPRRPRDPSARRPRPEQVGLHHRLGQVPHRGRATGRG